MGLLRCLILQLPFTKSWRRVFLRSWRLQNFKYGYIEKRCNAKRWIEEPADCKSMYDSYRKGDTITLCVKDNDGDTRLLVVVNQKITGEASLSSSSKRDIHESEVDKVFYELHSKHADDYTGP